MELKIIYSTLVSLFLVNVSTQEKKKNKKKLNIASGEFRDYSHVMHDNFYHEILG